MATDGHILSAQTKLPFFVFFPFISFLLVIFKLLWSSASCCLYSCLFVFLSPLKFTVPHSGCYTVLGVPIHWFVKPQASHGRSSLGSSKPMKSRAAFVRIDLLLSSRWVLRPPQIPKGSWPKNGKGHGEASAPSFQPRRGRVHGGKGLQLGRLCALFPHLIHTASRWDECCYFPK